MDNVIWLVLAAAVSIALAGIVLFIGSGSLDAVGNESDNIIEDTPNDPSEFSSFQELDQRQNQFQNLTINTRTNGVAI